MPLRSGEPQPATTHLQAAALQSSGVTYLEPKMFDWLIGHGRNIL